MNSENNSQPLEPTPPASGSIFNKPITRRDSLALAGKVLTGIAGAAVLGWGFSGCDDAANGYAGGSDSSKLENLTADQIIAKKTAVAYDAIVNNHLVSADKQVAAVLTATALKTNVTDALNEYRVFKKDITDYGSGGDETPGDTEKAAFANFAFQTGTYPEFAVMLYRELYEALGKYYAFLDMSDFSKQPDLALDLLPITFLQGQSIDTVMAMLDRLSKFYNNKLEIGKDDGMINAMNSNGDTGAIVFALLAAEALNKDDSISHIRDKANNIHNALSNAGGSEIAAMTLMSVLSGASNIEDYYNQFYGNGNLNSTTATTLAIASALTQDIQKVHNIFKFLYEWPSLDESTAAQLTLITAMQLLQTEPVPPSLLSLQEAFGVSYTPMVYYCFYNNLSSGYDEGATVDDGGDGANGSNDGGNGAGDGGDGGGDGAVGGGEGDIQKRRNPHISTRTS